MNGITYVLRGYNTGSLPFGYVTLLLSVFTVSQSGLSHHLLSLMVLQLQEDAGCFPPHSIITYNGPNHKPFSYNTQLH